jgi:hypothetical protein
LWHLYIGKKSHKNKTQKNNNWISPLSFMGERWRETQTEHGINYFTQNGYDMNKIN